MGPVDPVADAITYAIETAQRERLESNSRELSLVLTKLEEALLWRQQDVKLKS